MRAWTGWVVAVMMAACGGPAAEADLGSAVDAAASDAMSDIASPLDQGNVAVDAAAATEADLGSVVDAAASDAMNDIASPLDQGNVAVDPAHLTCSAQCDCPGGTTCTIEHVCVGDAFTASCSNAKPCGCGQTCNDGYCSLRVGNLKPCSFDCECSIWEVCSAGQCILPDISVVQTGCRSNADCGQCGGTICVLPGGNQCATPDRCRSDGHCLIQKGSGFECLCADGASADFRTCPSSEPNYTGKFVPQYDLGTCKPLAGQAFFNEVPLAVDPNPSQTAGFSNCTTLLVTGVSGTPSSVTFDAEHEITSGGGGFPVTFTLKGPGGVAQSISMDYLTGAAKWQTVDLVAGATTVNGTWSLCQEAINPGHDGGTVTRWGLYIK